MHEFKYELGDVVTLAAALEAAASATSAAGWQLPRVKITGRVETERAGGVRRQYEGRPVYPVGVGAATTFDEAELAALPAPALRSGGGGA